MQGFPIITADERLRETKGINGCIFGKTGIGKTSLLLTLPEESTLFVDLEAGDLAVRSWKGDTIRPRSWASCRDLALFIGGPTPAYRLNENYSSERYAKVLERFGDPSILDKYETIFIDSITVAARLCFEWCKGESLVLVNKKLTLDTRGAYGLLGQEMMAWLSQFQQMRQKNVWFVGILEEKQDEFKRWFFQPQIEGSKTGLELPGIVDEVITMADIPGVEADSVGTRAFVCQTINPYGYPAKDRSGALDMIEKPHLGDLMKKIWDFNKSCDSRSLNYPEFPDGSAEASADVAPEASPRGSPAALEASACETQRETQASEPTSPSSFPSGLNLSTYKNSV